MVRASSRPAAFTRRRAPCRRGEPFRRGLDAAGSARYRRTTCARSVAGPRRRKQRDRGQARRRRGQDQHGIAAAKCVTSTRMTPSGNRSSAAKRGGGPGVDRKRASGLERARDPFLREGHAMPGVRNQVARDPDSIALSGCRRGRRRSHMWCLRWWRSCRLDLVRMPPRA